jgi:hypothetical protein
VLLRLFPRAVTCTSCLHSLFVGCVGAGGESGRSCASLVKWTPRKAIDGSAEDSEEAPIDGTALGPAEFASAFMWAFIMLRCLMTRLGWTTLRSSLLHSGLVFSTHFSGIVTAEFLSACAIDFFAWTE